MTVLFAAASLAASIAHAWSVAGIRSAPQLQHRTAAACGVTRYNHPLAATASRARTRGIYLLNRLLLEPSECEVVTADSSAATGSRLVARLAADDPRTEHVRAQLKAADGQTVRAGVLDGGATDTARLHWERPADGAGSAGGLRLELGSTSLLEPVAEEARPRVDVVLVMPRPLQFARLLPMLSSMGIGTLWITGSRRVEKNYFSSHLLRPGREAELRTALVQGLEQSGDTAVPRVVVCRNLPKVLREYVGAADASSSVPALKLACHPERLENEDGAGGGEGSGGEAASAAVPRVRRLREVLVPEVVGGGRRVVLAIGPERGWEEPEELELLASLGFDLVTLGPRTLRTDVACVALLAVAHDLLDASEP